MCVHHYSYNCKCISYYRSLRVQLHFSTSARALADSLVRLQWVKLKEK